MLMRNKSIYLKRSKTKSEKLEVRVKELERVELQRQYDRLDKKSTLTVVTALSAVVFVGVDVWAAATFPQLWGIIAVGNILLSFCAALAVKLNCKKTPLEEKLKKQLNTK